MRFRDLSISTRLAVATLVLLIPVAVLVYFMDISFRYDINIGKDEFAGTELLRHVYPLLEIICDDQHVMTEEEMKRRRELARHAFQELHEMVKETPKSFMLSDVDLRIRDKLGVKPAQLAEAWEAYLDAPTTEARQQLLNNTLDLMVHIGRFSKLLLDPALDSAVLADALVAVLPNCKRDLLDLRRLLRLTQMPEERGPISLFTSDTAFRDILLRWHEHYITSCLYRLRDDSTAALTEDPLYYGLSPSLQRNYKAAYEKAMSASERLSSSVRALIDGESVNSMFLAEQIKTADTAVDKLFFTGLNELDILIKYRIDEYLDWRIMAGALSATAVLLAIALLVAVSLSITRGLRCVMQYTHRVATGDLDAYVKEPIGAELGVLADGIHTMVLNLKHKIGFLNGVLRGLTIPCLTVDTEEHVTFINQPYLQLYGLQGTPDDYLGKTLGELYYNDSTADTITGRAMRARKPLLGNESSTITRDGRSVHVKYDVAPVFDLDNRLIGAFAIIIDLTEIKKNAEKISRLAAFPRKSLNPVLSAMKGGALHYINPATASITRRWGLDPRRDLLPGNHSSIVDACLATGSTRDNIESLVGDRVFDWTYTPVPGQELVHIYGNDITERKRMEERLLYDAFHDSLTGLPNRALFEDRLGQVCRRYKRDSAASFSLLFLDLDHFKHVNDSLGHVVGDELLTEVAERIVSTLRSFDTLARLGGDEFVLLLENTQGLDDAQAAVKRIQDVLASPITVVNSDIFVEVSIGIVVSGHPDKTPGELLRDADAAMYRAKSLGRGRAEVFNDDLHKQAMDRLHLESELKKAVEHQEFIVFYQPIVHLDTGKIHGFEALVRWESLTRGLVPPGMFIPHMENSGLIIDVGAFVLEHALQTAKMWRETIPGYEHLFMSVNLAVRQLTKPGIVDDVAEVLTRWPCPRGSLKLEITESGIMENFHVAQSILADLRELGVRLSIDDFGTGYSSLSYLHRLPFDSLKVDRSFVTLLQQKAENLEITKTIVALAHSLSKDIIAEGVETPNQLNTLRHLGCEYGQGYLFAKPLPATEAEQLLKNQPSW
ncbi:EAL domain-containing protein [Desulfovibrio inopinatus]|uniref:EAL domain-containing protein n=1 Tax=Desulfovibrio inopinatus TaxID=102109 RepID=UPI00041C9B71|nr:EAL domain-containing protein [Desulfovibrio inopinatus]